MKNILAFLSRFFSYGTELRPVRDWYVLLSFIFILLMASVFYNAWSFLEVYRGEVLSFEHKEIKQSFNSKPIETSRLIFEKRAEEERAYRFEHRFIDPSL